jgi:hypothetical protein
VEAGVWKWCRQQPSQFFADGMKNLVTRWRKCVARNGEEASCEILYSVTNQSISVANPIQSYIFQMEHMVCYGVKIIGIALDF